MSLISWSCAGCDTSADFDRAMSLATAYGVEPWSVHLAAFAALLTALRSHTAADAGPPATALPASAEMAVERDLHVLMQQPAQLLWALTEDLLPQLSANAPLQWLLFTRAVAQALQAADIDANAAQSISQLHSFAQAAVASGDAAAPLLATLLSTAATQLLAPLWPQLESPGEAVSNSTAPRAADSTAAQAALWTHVNSSNADAVCSALQYWPAADAVSEGLCGISSDVARVLAFIKSLCASSTSGTAPDQDMRNVVQFCQQQLVALPATHFTALLQWVVGGAACPGIHWGQGQCPEPPQPLPLHPQVQLSLLQAVQRAPDFDDSTMRSVRRLRAWQSVHAALANAVSDANDVAEPGDLHQLLQDESDEAWQMVAEAEMAAQEGPALVASGALHAGALLPAIAAAAEGTAEAFEVDFEVGSALPGVYRRHAESALKRLADSVAAGAHGDDSAGAHALWDLEKAVDSLAADPQPELACSSALTHILLQAMDETCANATGTQLQHPLMHSLMALRAKLSQQQGGAVADGSQGPSVLQLQTRAMLAHGFGDAAAPSAANVHDAASAAQYFGSLVQEAETREQLHALYGTLAGVWQFGDAWGNAAGRDSDPVGCVPMHASCCALAYSFARQGMVLQCANMVAMRHALDADSNNSSSSDGLQLLTSDEMSTVVATAHESGGTLAAAAVALASQDLELAGSALEGLQGGTAASEHRSAECAAVLLSALALQPVKKLQACLCQRSAKSAVLTAAQALPHISDAPACSALVRSIETAFLRFVATLCQAGSGGPIMLAAELAADYVCLNPGMRLLADELAALKQYLRACEARLHAAGPASPMSDRSWARVAECVLPQCGVGEIAVAAAIAGVDQACVNRF